MHSDAFVDKCLRDIEFGYHLREEEFVPLHRTDRLSEGFPLLSVGHSLLEDAPRMGKVCDAAADPLPGQHLHHVNEPLIYFSDDVGALDADVVEEEFGCVGLGLSYFV